ncbi:hypothetical protein VNO78_16082 [Psophocarpus tetragonolobus]|uniref:Uncharacterized protein n=1 Tax=Psophocarpus tetragonolobus TaxID=3891 RepID=A0AAN9SF62_PSOTE
MAFSRRPSVESQEGHNEWLMGIGEDNYSVGLWEEEDADTITFVGDVEHCFETVWGPQMQIVNNTQSDGKGVLSIVRAFDIGMSQGNRSLYTKVTYQVGNGPKCTQVSECGSSNVGGVNSKPKNEIGPSNQLQCCPIDDTRVLEKNEQEVDMNVAEIELLMDVPI